MRLGTSITTACTASLLHEVNAEHGGNGNVLQSRQPSGPRDSGSRLPGRRGPKFVRGKSTPASRVPSRNPKRLGFSSDFTVLRVTPA